MPSIPQLTSAIQTMLPDVAQQAAAQTGFVRRQRAISGAQFVQTLVCGWLADPAADYESLVSLATDLGVSITPQGLCDRFTAAAGACLEQVLFQAVEAARTTGYEPRDAAQASGVRAIRQVHRAVAATLADACRLLDVAEPLIGQGSACGAGVGSTDCASVAV